MVPDANPKEVSLSIVIKYLQIAGPEGVEEGAANIKIKPGFIKILPKLTEEKVIPETYKVLKNKSVGYLPADEIDAHFKSQKGFSTEGAAVEYLVVRRTMNDQTYDVNSDSEDNMDIKNNTHNAFAGYTSLPGGLVNYGENALDAVVRTTYEQTGFDLTDHTKFCFVTQSAKNYRMRYLPNQRVIVAKPFIF